MTLLPVCLKSGQFKEKGQRPWLNRLSHPFLIQNEMAKNMSKRIIFEPFQFLFDCAKTYQIGVEEGPMCKEKKGVEDFYEDFFGRCEQKPIQELKDYYDQGYDISSSPMVLPKKTSRTDKLPC
jgi:hypothetical protein